MFKHYLYAVLQWLNSPSLEVSPTQWQRNKNTIGGGGGGRKRLRSSQLSPRSHPCAKVQNWGEMGGGGGGGGKGGRLKPPISATLGPTNPKLDSCMFLVCKSNKLALFGNYAIAYQISCAQHHFISVY